jgi:Zn-dependent peptidase ImmA (M78 family)/transcriptional regulator with XRE-family HTH domain
MTPGISKLGISTFEPSRLVHAREARAMTMNSLAELVSISRQSLSAYEGGKQLPSLEVIDRLASRLNVPARHLMMPEGSNRPYKYSYRSLSAATKRARTKAERRFEWFLEVYGWINEIIELPPTDLPDFKIEDPLSLSDEDVEELAVQTRLHWGLGNGPIGHMIELLESHGIVVTRFPLDSAHLDSFSAHTKTDAPPFIVLNEEKKSAVRSRLDAAHELGHLILHRGLAFGTHDHKRAEEQAFRFGAAFLFPEISFLREVVVVSLPAFAVLKRRWHVSIGMMIKRANDLELAQPHHIERLWKYYSAKGYGRKGEPGDDLTSPEQPSLLARAFAMTFDEGFGQRESLLDRVPLYAHEIEEISSLPEGLVATPAKPIQLKPRQGASPANGEGGSVVSFSRGSNGSK